MKRRDFKAAIDQIEAALNGEDAAPTEIEPAIDGDTTVDEANETTVNDDDSQLDETFDQSYGFDESEAKGDASQSDAENIDKSKVDIDNEEQQQQQQQISSRSTSTATNDEKNTSRSGRVIKRTKYLHDEFEEAPVIPKKKPVIEKPASKAKKSDEIELGDVQNLNLTLLKAEKSLICYDLEIKTSLQLSNADPDKCISVLEKYKSLSITPLMLKKNPSVVLTMKRLRRYVGNVKIWNFSDDEQIEFSKKAEKIQELADTIYKKFMV